MEASHATSNQHTSCPRPSNAVYPVRNHQATINKIATCFIFYVDIIFTSRIIFFRSRKINVPDNKGTSSGFMFYMKIQTFNSGACRHCISKRTIKVEWVHSCSVTCLLSICCIDISLETWLKNDRRIGHIHWRNIIKLCWYGNAIILEWKWYSRVNDIS